MLVFENKKEFIALINEALEPRFDAIDKKFDTIDSRFEAIDRKFEAIDKKFEGIDNKFEAMDMKFTSRMDAMDEKFTDQFRYQAILMEDMNRKIDVLYDGRIDANSLNAKLDSLIEVVEDHTERIDIMEKVLKDHVQDKTIHLPNNN